ncbi:MAG: hypothetical protein MJZ67_07165 [Bacteroidales bacterium]|nr:hypothetical protein [Bacteroidales bacterium]
MEYRDIVVLLRSRKVNEIKSQTVLGTFSNISRSSLLTCEVGNRNNARWKRAEYVIASFSDDGVDFSSYLEGWNLVAFDDQTLFIEKEPNEWEQF